MKLFPFTHFHPDCCSVLPRLLITIGRCANPDCHKVHGLRLEIGWFFWGFGVDVIFTPAFPTA